MSAEVCWRCGRADCEWLAQHREYGVAGARQDHQCQARARNNASPGTLEALHNLPDLERDNPSFVGAAAIRRAGGEVQRG